MADLAKACAAWEAAVRAWSRCDHSDAIEAMKLGEAMMYAATDFLCAKDDVIAKANTLSDTLNAYGYPVSDAHWNNSSGAMSIQARGLHLAAASYREARTA
jgi:hypothetical protein